MFKGKRSSSINVNSSAFQTCCIFFLLLSSNMSLISLPVVSLLFYDSKMGEISMNLSRLLHNEAEKTQGKVTHPGYLG